MDHYIPETAALLREIQTLKVQNITHIEALALDPSRVQSFAREIPQLLPDSNVALVIKPSKKERKAFHFLFGEKVKQMEGSEGTMWMVTDADGIRIDRSLFEKTKDPQTDLDCERLCFGTDKKGNTVFGPAETLKKDGIEWDGSLLFVKDDDQTYFLIQHRNHEKNSDSAYQHGLDISSIPLEDYNSQQEIQRDIQELELQSLRATQQTRTEFLGANIYAVAVILGAGIDALIQHIPALSQNLQAWTEVMGGANMLSPAIRELAKHIGLIAAGTTSVGGILNYDVAMRVSNDLKTQLVTRARRLLSQPEIVRLIPRLPDELAPQDTIMSTFDLLRQSDPNDPDANIIISGKEFPLTSDPIMITSDTHPEIFCILANDQEGLTIRNNQGDVTKITDAFRINVPQPNTEKKAIYVGEKNGIIYTDHLSEFLHKDVKLPPNVKIEITTKQGSTTVKIQHLNSQETNNLTDGIRVKQMGQEELTDTIRILQDIDKLKSDSTRALHSLAKVPALIAGTAAITALLSIAIPSVRETILHGGIPTIASPFETGIGAHWNFTNTDRELFINLVKNYALDAGRSIGLLGSAAIETGIAMMLKNNVVLKRYTEQVLTAIQKSREKKHE